MEYLTDEERKLLPANIYKTYKEYMGESAYVRKLGLLLDTFKQTVHFFGCVFLSEYLYEENISEKVKSKTNKMIPSLARPSLGAWYGFVRDFYKGRNDDEVFVKGFNGCMKEIMSHKGLDIYKGRFRKDTAFMNVFDELIAIRNSIAHGAVSPDEGEAKEILEIYSIYLDIILRGYIPIFKEYAVVKLIELEDDYDSFTVYFDIINYDEKYDDRYTVKYDYEEQEMYLGNGDEAVGKMFILCKDRRLLRLAEYLLDIPDDHEHEDYYLFDGLGNKDVVYLGMKYRKFMTKYLEDVQRRFREKGASTKWTRDSFDMESFKNTLDSLVNSVVGIHIDSKKYIPDVYVERECDYAFFEFIESDKTTLVVTAEAGVGKTCFLCHAASECKKRGYFTYMFNGNTLVKTDSDSILYDRMKSDFLDAKTFPNFGEFLAFFDQKNKNNDKFVLLLDAVNEAYHVEYVLSEIDRMSNYGKQYPWLKIVVTIRTVSFNLFRNRISDAYGKKLPLFTQKERYYSVKNDGREEYWIVISEWNILQTIEAFKKYSHKYSISDKHESFHKMSREFQGLMMNPLNLSLYFSAIDKESEMDVDIKTEYDLFYMLELSWGSEGAVTDSVNKTKEDIVYAMIEQKTNELDADLVREIDEKNKNKNAEDIRLFLLSPYERLKDLGVLYEKSCDQMTIVAFVYQKYLEYQLIKAFARRKCSIGEIAENMLEAGKYTKLPEEEIAWLQLLKSSDNRVCALETLLKKAQEKNIKIDEVKVASEELIILAVIDGKSDEVVAKLIDYSILSWGIKSVIKLADSEESDAAEALLKAILNKKEALTKDDLQEVYFRYGLLCMKISHHDEAGEFLQKAIDIAETDRAAASKVQLAKNLRQSGHVEEAKRILEEFLIATDEDKPYYADALIQRGLCKKSDKDYEGALEDYLCAEKISKKQNEYYITIYNQLGISSVYKDLGQYEKAEKVLYEVYRESSKRGYISLLSDSLNGLADSFLRKGEYDSSIECAKQGLVIWEHSRYYRGQMVMFCHLIKAYRNIGDHEHEVEYFKERAELIMDHIKEKVILEEYYDAISE